MLIFDLHIYYDLSCFNKFISSFGVSGPSQGLYDLSRTMESSEYSHLIVVKNCHLKEYQGQFYFDFTFNWEQI